MAYMCGGLLHGFALIRQLDKARPSEAQETSHVHVCAFLIKQQRHFHKRQLLRAIEHTPHTRLARAWFGHLLDSTVESVANS